MDPSEWFQKSVFGRPHSVWNPLGHQPYQFTHVDIDLVLDLDLDLDVDLAGIIYE
jgi:hypothetical protein